MASIWRYGKRSKYRAKVSQDPEDYYRLDPKKSPAENAYDIYTALCCRETRDTKRLFLLNGLATLCQQQQQLLQQQKLQHQQIHQAPVSAPPPTPAPTPPPLPSTQLLQQQQHQQQQQQQQQQEKNNLGFTTEELLYCLSASLIHTFTQVRAAALRTIRYALYTPKDIKIFNSMQLQHLVVRSIDVLLRNDDERVQALKLIRKMLAISAEDISPVIVRCLVSLADNGIEDGDTLLRACLATLCEFAVLNPTLLIVCGGVTAITRNVLECHNPRIAESLSGVLLYLLEWPQTRNISGVRLDCLAAPYCDFTYRLGIMDKNKDARELRYTSCRLALLSVLRSWTGTIEFCDPSKPSGLKAIVDALYLNQLEVRKAILDLLYELLGLPQPALTDDYAAALQAVDPSDLQDAWLLSNGFVAAEGRSILPSLAARAPNVCEQHLALLLYCFLETGLLNALIEVIVSSDAQISVRATVLMGNILHLMHTHLPPDICSTSPALPTLLTQATQGNQQAIAAISALQSYQKMLRNRPASCSLFLDSIIQGGSLIHTRLFRRDINAQEISQNVTAAAGATSQLQSGGGGTLERPRLDSVSSSDESSQTSSSRRSSFRLKRKLLPFFENLRVNRLIKDSNVLSLPDGNAWDWEVVTTILRSNLIRKIDDSSGKFLKRLVNYFKPSSNRFSHQDLAHGRSLPPYVTAGLDLIDWLLSNYVLESIRLLTDLFSDVSQHLLAVTTSNRAHDCLFSPQHMSNTMCQQYFLYIGRMCRVQKGISILTNTAVFEHLINLVRNTDHICYVKLIVSGLDYSLDSVTRKVLEKALTSSKTRNGRLYATQFLVVLLRARIPNFEVWGIPMIIQQTKDPDRSVVLAAIDVLEEACHEKYYLEEIVSLWPNLKSLGDVGLLLMSRYYSLSRGLNHRKARIKEEIEYWKNGYNKRYVLLIEADTHSSLTLHIRNEDGYYSRRNCSTRPTIIPPNIPPHLYGQMVQTAQGTTALRKHGDLQHLVDVISRGKCTDDTECLELKAAIWAVGHASTHSNGIEFLVESGTRIYEKLVILATKCDVYSIRATCFNILGLIGGTNAGANILFKLNWLSVRHDRNTNWPVHQPEDWMSSNYTPTRHYYEDVPPYNYTGIDDQIDGSYYTGSYWNMLLSSSSTTNNEGAASASSEQQDVNTTVESSKTAAEENNKHIVAVKSKTLPESTFTRHGKHQRSLSDAKTTDVISIIGGVATGVHHQNRVRYISCTDSNTSGVSSCESVPGRAAVAGEFQQVPLSPIPSMSNLLDIPPQAVRRTTLAGNSYLQHAISPVDLKGSAQLRWLRRHCRPVLSESATDLYEIIDRKDLLSYASFRPRKSSWSETQRHMKVRSLDRQSSLRMFTQLDTAELQVPLPTLAPPKFLSQNDSKGPCYAGICLPKNLLDLFPTRNLARTYVSRDIQDQDLMDINLLTAKQQFLNDSLNNEGDESSVISSLSDVSSVSKRSKWLGTKHGRGNCLHCSRTRRNRQHPHRLDSETNLHSSSGGAGIITGANASAVNAPATANVTAARKSKSNQSSSIQLSDISFNSPESILSEESMPDRLTANILFNVQRLANPVSAKQSKNALLEVKQKHPHTFQDICLYAEVCKSLGRSSYRMTARRFLQELFLDLNFDSFYVEPIEIISKKDKDFPESVIMESSSSLEAATRANKRLTELNLGMGGGIDSVDAPSSSSQSHHTSASRITVISNTNLISGGATTSAAVGAPTASSGSASSSYSGGGHKSHIKHTTQQPALASVYETSCENLLLEQSPRPPPILPAATQQEKQQKCSLSNLKNSSSFSSSKAQTTTPAATSITAAAATATPTATIANSSSCSSSNTSSTTPRFIIQQTTFQNELHIGSEEDDDDDDEADDVAKDDVDDEVVGVLFQRRQELQGGSQRNATPISNISDQTTNSNRSSICTISNHPVNTSITTSVSGTPTPIENENKKYTRGRFYTLELDLSCTKNKFPITDRRRSTSTIATTTITTNEPASGTTRGAISTAIANTTSTTTTTTNANTNTSSSKTTSPARPSIQRQLSWGSNSNTQYQMTAGSRQSYPGTTPGCGASNTTAISSYSTVSTCDASQPATSNSSIYLHPLHMLSATSPMTITKSLAASLAKPIGSLYCEKRLQSSKSEAVLTNTSTATRLLSKPLTLAAPLAAVATTTSTVTVTTASKN